jgi:cholesterol oxidase
MGHTKAIVVGSGFGGAVAALRLGQAGIKTVVLERGRRWPLTDTTKDGTFATFRHPDGRAEWLHTTTMTPGYEGIPIRKQPGVLEILLEGECTYLVGAGVGGGSLVYGAILMQPPGDFFREVFPASVDYGEMDRVYYPRVRSVIKAGKIPDDVFDSKYYAGLQVLCEHARKAGFVEKSSTTELGDGFARFEMGIDWDVVRAEIAGTAVPSVIAAEFWFGNNSGAKQSLDRNYLRQAEATGAVEILPLHSVTDLAARPEGGYRVQCNLLDDNGEVAGTTVQTCDYLFMAAGTLGTVTLLHRARARGGLPNINDQLGEGFGNDGDVFLIRDELKEVTNPHLGGPGAVAVMNYDNPHGPCVMMRAPYPRFAVDFPKLNAIGTFVFVQTDNRGRLGYDRAADRLLIDFKPNAPDAARLLAERLNKAAGGRLLSLASRVTGHQVGGACMGGPCDDVGRVAGHPGLYVVDGSLIPGSSTCCNPALTIAAVAERALERLLATDLKREHSAH